MALCSCNYSYDKAATASDSIHIDIYADIFYCLNLKHKWGHPADFMCSHARDSVTNVKRDDEHHLSTAIVYGPKPLCLPYEQDSTILFVKVTQYHRNTDSVLLEYKHKSIKKSLSIQNLRHLKERQGNSKAITTKRQEIWIATAEIDNEEVSVFYAMRLQKDKKTNDWYYLEYICKMPHSAYDYPVDNTHENTKLNERFWYILNNSKTM